MCHLKCNKSLLGVWRTARVLPFEQTEDEGSSPPMSWTATNFCVSNNEKEVHWFWSSLLTKSQYTVPQPAPFQLV